MNINDIVVIGCGGCGNNQLEQLMQINRRYTGIFINTNLSEMKRLKHYDERISHYVNGADGCGQDRDLCESYLKTEAPKIIDKLRGFEDKNTIVMLASASGGTGSKTITYMPKIIKAFFPKKSINLVVTMPSTNSTIMSLDNAIDTWNEIIENKKEKFIDSIMFINNNKFKDENIINNKAMIELNNCLTFNGVKIDTTDSKRVNTANGYKVVLELSDIDNLEDNIEIAIQNSMFYVPNELECNYLVGSVHNDINIDDINSLFKGYDFKKVEHNKKLNRIILGGCEMPRKAIKEVKEAKNILLELKRNKINEDIDDLKVRTHKDISKEDDKITDQDIDELFNNDDFWNQFS